MNQRRKAVGGVGKNKETCDNLPAAQAFALRGSKNNEEGKITFF